MADNHRQCVVGWGLKRNTNYARRYATRHGLPYLTIEDGFLRSVGLGVMRSPPLSLVIDELGIYYDATRPSRLEVMLNGETDVSPDSALSDSPPGDDVLDDQILMDRASRCMEKIVGSRLSKYNSSPEQSLALTDKKRVLVVDQTAGDLSIQYGLANAESFTRMLDAALSEHPDAEILVKIHPDVIAGKKQGHLLAAADSNRVKVLSKDINPISLVSQVDYVYVVSSQLGFEALMLNKPVTCFGAPFYAGWGLTDDRVDLPRRKKKRSIQQLFAAAYILYSRYRDPETGAACEIETVIDHLALQRHWFRENTGTFYCYGFGLWKRGYIRRYLYSPWNRVRFFRWQYQVRKNLPDVDARIVVWGNRDNAALEVFARDNSLPLWRMEDGFLRSVGLGSDLTAPASLVVDKRGIYFDPSRASDLEHILQNQNFSESDLQRAKILRNTIVASGLSKYNVGHTRSFVPTASPGQRIILVPGQVEDDASIQLGCPDIRTNAQLLSAVRNQAPDAHIIYKPHPDVLSGNRHAGSGADRTKHYDELVTDIGIARCLEVVDEVHTMTSLVGFEGLLRGKQVVTYGLPFYSGWGLTSDHHHCKRRSRRLEIDELVAGALLKYSRYLYGYTGNFTAVETVVGYLEHQRAMLGDKDLVTSSLFNRLGRKSAHFITGFFYGR